MTTAAQPTRTAQATVITRAAGVRAQDGFSIIEVLVASIILVVGMISLVGSFDPARQLDTSAEQRQTALSLATREIERIQSLNWSQIALRTAPVANTDGGGTGDPTHYVSAGPCVGEGPVTSPCYQWDWNTPADIEPLVVDSVNGDTTPNPTPWSTTVSTTSSSVRLSGYIYRFVTWVNDTECTISGACGAANDYKRVTVAVTVNGLTVPVTLSTLVTNPVGGSGDPLDATGVTCQDGTQAVSCTH